MNIPEIILIKTLEWILCDCVFGSSPYHEYGGTLHAGKAFWPTSTSDYSWKVSSCLSSSSFVCRSPPLPPPLPPHLVSSSKDVHTFKTPVYLCSSVMFTDSPLVPVECKQTGYTMVTAHLHPGTNNLSSHFNTQVYKPYCIMRRGILITASSDYGSQALFSRGP